MSDRTDLLNSIAANPDEDTPRLMYADWLDEFGEGDLDAATVEFIRVSCLSRKVSKVMPHAGYKWVNKNWHRLIPTLYSRFSGTVLNEELSRRGYPFKTKITFHRKGRWIHTRFVIPNPRWAPGLARVGFYHVTCNLAFWKGFVSALEMWSTWGLEQVGKALKEDQPLMSKAIQNSREEFLL